MKKIIACRPPFWTTPFVALEIISILDRKSRMVNKQKTIEKNLKIVCFFNKSTI